MQQNDASQFAVEGVTFSMKDQLMMIDVENDFAQATLTTHGATVLSFIPKTGSSAGEDIIWVSPAALYDGKKPVRGGVPVCWPWFGAHPTEQGMPAHGVVRNATWQLEAVNALENGIIEVIMSISASEQTLALWPHAFNLSLRVEIGEQLAMTLTTHNPNAYDLEITEALHTYFAVADCQNTVIKGLDKAVHLNKLEEVPAEAQEGDVTLKPPMDSVYLGQLGPMTFEDVNHHRTICIEQNGQSAVVWSPGPEGVKGFADIPDQVWSTFMCVEAGNVLGNSVTVPSESKHHFSMVISAL